MAPNAELEFEAGAEPPKLNLGVVVPLVVAPLVSAGALKPKTLGLGLAGSSPSAPLNDEVDFAGAGAVGAADLGGPKLNFRPEGAEEPAAEEGAAGAEVEAGCEGAVICVGFPNTEVAFGVSVGLNENIDPFCLG